MRFKLSANCFNRPATPGPRVEGRLANCPVDSLRPQKAIASGVTQSPPPMGAAGGGENAGRFRRADLKPLYSKLTQNFLPRATYRQSVTSTLNRTIATILHRSAQPPTHPKSQTIAPIHSPSSNTVCAAGLSARGWACATPPSRHPWPIASGTSRSRSSRWKSPTQTNDRSELLASYRALWHVQQ